MIVSPDGKVINNESAVGMVSSDPEGKNFPWTPPLVSNIDTVGGFINEATTMLVLAEGASEAAASIAEAAVNSVAAAAIAGGTDLRFGFAGPGNKDSDMLKQIRNLTHMGEATDEPLVLLIDIPNSGAFYALEPAYGCTVESLEQMLKDYSAKELTRKQLG